MSPRSRCAWRSAAGKSKCSDASPYLPSQDALRLERRHRDAGLVAAVEKLRSAAAYGPGRCSSRPNASPDLVHIQAIGPALLTPLARLLGLRVVVTHHGFDYERQKWGWFAKSILRAGEAMGMIFSNANIGVSKAIADKVRHNFGVAANFIPNGVESDFPKLGTSYLDSIEVTPKRYILTVGRIVEEKRQLDLISAFARLHDPDTKLADRRQGRPRRELSTRGRAGGSGDARRGDDRIPVRRGAFPALSARRPFRSSVEPRRHADRAARGAQPWDTVPGQRYRCQSCARSRDRKTISRWAR